MDDGFLGYARGNGRAGVRNHLLILSVTGLTGPAARRAGRSLPRAVVVVNPYGNGVIGEDGAIHRRALRGLVTHPNVGAVVVLGGEPAKVSDVVDAAEAADKAAIGLTLEGAGHDGLRLADQAMRAGAGLLRALSAARRSPQPLAALTLGLECGRSDPSSGLVANPLLGRIADRVVAAGGQAMIGETTEWLGAEHLLARRASSPEAAEAILAAARGRVSLAEAAGIDLTGNNPSETNIAAGLSSIEEKSLGAIAKSGRGPIAGLIHYGESPPRPGMWVMNAPAYAPESLTGFTAAGAALLLFTTGVGNSHSSALAPTLKVSANPETVARLDCQLDFTAEAVFRGEEALDDAAERLLALVRDTASGTLSWGEIFAESDEVISRFGPSL